MDFDRLCLRCMREGVDPQAGSCSLCGAPVGFKQDPPFALPPGTVLHGQYITGAALGCGGFGITYIAVDLRQEHRVAIKEFMPSGLCTRRPGETAVLLQTGAEDFRYGKEQFLQEARTIYECRGNADIIEVEKLFEENGTAYYVMEFLEGEDLRKYLNRRGGKLAFNEALNLLQPVFRALERVHSRGIVHRDVSPDNIFICTNGKVQLLDFGAARAALGERSQSIDVILKRGYAPVEQYSSHGNLGPWTDVYALACTLYHCLTGRVPPESMERMQKDSCFPLAQYSFNVPIEAERVLQRAMAPRAEFRYRTVGEFRAELYATTQQPGAPRVVQGNTQEPTPQQVVSSSSVSQPSAANVLGRRVGAYLLDSLIVGLLSAAVLLLIGKYLYIGLWFVIIFLLCVLYGYGMESTSSHATLGKRAVGLSVQEQNGESLQPGAALLRNVIKYLPILAGCIPNTFIWLGGALTLADALFALGDTGYTLHDRAANSAVRLPAVFAAEMVPVQIPPQARGRRGVLCISGLFTGNFFPLDGGKLILGRDTEACNVIFPSGAAGISARHCELLWDASANTAVLRDLGSTYGTFVAGGRLAPQQLVMLRPGDSFTIGEKNVFLVKNEA